MNYPDMIKDIIVSFVTEVGVVRTVISFVVCEVVLLALPITTSVGTAFKENQITLGEYTSIVLLTVLILLMSLMYLGEYAELLLDWCVPLKDIIKKYRAGDVLNG